MDKDKKIHIYEKILNYEPFRIIVKPLINKGLIKKKKPQIRLQPQEFEFLQGSTKYKMLFSYYYLYYNNS